MGISSFVNVNIIFRSFVFISCYSNNFFGKNTYILQLADADGSFAEIHALAL